jgi:predicted Zn-dependent peptidase
MEVTNEDIQRAANTYFTPERMTVAHILPIQAPMQ